MDIVNIEDLRYAPTQKDRDWVHSRSGGFGSLAGTLQGVGWLLFEAFGHVGSRQVQEVTAIPSWTFMQRSYLVANVGGHGSETTVKVLVDVDEREVLPGLLTWEMAESERLRSTP